MTPFEVTATLQAALHAATQAIPDTLPASPLPGGVSAVVRFFFHVPQWIQIGGAGLAGVVAVVLLLSLWRRRAGIGRWILTWPSALKAGMAAALLALVIVAAGFGKASWDYMQHDNDFCIGCHVMDASFQRFTDSKHAELQCHDCHRQSILASARQLYLWALERPEEIGEHAPVPNRICAECHIQERPDSLWQRIAATAGHRVHLEADTSVLADLMCVTCHGREVHRFVPADQTCGQADCHAEETTQIVLGKMAAQTGFHCVTCHEFTAEVSEAVPVDTAATALVPRESKCFSCHDMEQLMEGFDAAVDPHEAVCGACHNPHEQEMPEAAFATCTGGGCHARPDTLSPFHRGIAFAALEDCGSCHVAHEWEVEGKNCVACHPDVASAGPAGLLLVAFFGRSWLADRSRGPDPGDGTKQMRVSQAPFRHRDHGDVACTDCHSSKEEHGRVTASARDCFSCHHADATAGRTECGSCHRPQDLAGARAFGTALRLSVWEAPRRRELPIAHQAHGELACADCHGGRALEVTSSCAECHAEHHEPGAACIACHSAQPPTEVHPIELHVASSCGGEGCHAAAAGVAEEVVYATLPKTRSYCLSCHQDQVDHEPDESCAGCHLVPDAEMIRSDR